MSVKQTTERIKLQIIQKYIVCISTLVRMMSMVRLNEILENVEQFREFHTCTAKVESKWCNQEEREAKKQND